MTTNKENKKRLNRHNLKEEMDEFVYTITHFPYRKFRALLWHFILLMLTVFFTAFFMDIYFSISHKFIKQLL